MTLGVERMGGWRVVLHRGVATGGGIAFTDVAALARWPSPDRGVVQLRSLEEIGTVAPRLARLIGDWVAAG